MGCKESNQTNKQTKLHIIEKQVFWMIFQGFFQQFWEKAPGQNWEKMINLTAKLGEINNIEHNIPLSMI